MEYLMQYNKNDAINITKLLSYAKKDILNNNLFTENDIIDEIEILLNNETQKAFRELKDKKGKTFSCTEALFYGLDN